MWKCIGPARRSFFYESEKRLIESWEKNTKTENYKTERVLIIVYIFFFF